MTPRGTAWLWVAALVSVGGCARPGVPAGGDVPETPLRAAETRPESGTVVAPFDGPIVVEFQRRISERLTEGALRDAIVVSPRVGEVEVRTQRRGIEIRMEGGFRERTVYRITVLPRFQDLYQNRMAEPFDIVFSTGDELEPNLLAGIVTDRLTLEAVGGARIDVASPGEGYAHSTVTDDEGIFTFPHLPAGEYALVAYQDLNRNRAPDFLEPQDSTEVSLARGDTIIVTEPALLLPDTTAAVLQTAQPVDSLAVRLAFDDYLDPDDPLTQVVGRVIREDGADPEVVEILHAHEWAARAAPDPDALPDLPPDDPGAPAVPPPADAAPPDAQPSDVQAAEPVLPARELVLVLAAPLEPGAPYRAEVEGVTNINGVPGGGGDAGFEGPPEPQPDPVPEPNVPGPDDPDPDAPGPDAPDPAGPDPPDAAPPP